MPFTYINTGTSPNAGNGDSIRTAFTKVNSTFQHIEQSLADLEASVGDGIVIQFTVTDLLTVMGGINLNGGVLTVNTSTGVILLNGNVYTPYDQSLNTSDSVSFAQVSSVGTLYQGTASNRVEYPHTTIRVDADTDSYSAMILQNHNAGESASTDIALMNDIGTDSDFFIDLGINSSNYAAPEFDLHSPNSGYLFTVGGDLVIGTQSPSTRLIFHAGGSTATDSAGVLTSESWEFNRQVTVAAEKNGGLIFSTYNSSAGTDASVSYQGVNNQGAFFQIGVNGSNKSFNNVQGNEFFLYTGGPEQTMHIGSNASINFYANAATGNSGAAVLTIDKDTQSSTFRGHVLPGADVTYDLGSSSTQWRSLWVGTSTIYIGGVPISVNPTSNTLAVGATGTATSTATNLATESFVIDYVGQSGGGTANTGDVTFEGVKIIGAGTASGDGNGYSTLELVPDANLTATNQYLVIDPTTPNHIHLRAGGPQDSSSAELYLGGEHKNVRINDSAGVKLNNNFLAGLPTRQYVINTDFTNATWWDSGEGTYFLQFTTSNVELQTVHDQFGGWPDNTIEIWTGSALYTLTYDGYSTYLGNPNDRIIRVREAPPGGTTVNVQAMTFTLYSYEQNYINLEYSSLDISVNGTAGIVSNDFASIYAKLGIIFVSGQGNLTIVTNDETDAKEWKFNTKGHLLFPYGTAPASSKGSEGDMLGAVAFDDNYIYYCTTDYDGVTDIWKRVAWSNDTW